MNANFHFSHYEQSQVLLAGGQVFFPQEELPFSPHLTMTNLTIDSAQNEWNNLDKTMFLSHY